MDWSLFVGLLFAIALSIIANMLTPTIQRRWAQTNEDRKVKRIAKLKAELQKLEAGKSLPTAQPPSVALEPFTKQPRLEAAAGGSVIEWEDLKAYYIEFTNAEHRYPTTAHNLRASVTYTPF